MRLHSHQPFPSNGGWSHLQIIITLDVAWRINETIVRYWSRSSSLFACLLTLIKLNEELIRRFLFISSSDLIVFHVETFNVYTFNSIIHRALRLEQSVEKQKSVISYEYLRTTLEKNSFLPLKIEINIYLYNFICANLEKKLHEKGIYLSVENIKLTFGYLGWYLYACTSGCKFIIFRLDREFQEKENWFERKKNGGKMRDKNSKFLLFCIHFFLFFFFLSPLF